MMADERNFNLLSLLQANPVGQSYQQGFSNALATFGAGLERDKFGLAQKTQAAQEAYQNRALGLEESKFGYGKGVDRMRSRIEDIAAKGQAEIASIQSQLGEGEKVAYDVSEEEVDTPNGIRVIPVVSNVRKISDAEYWAKSKAEKAAIDRQTAQAKKMVAELRKTREAIASQGSTPTIDKQQQPTAPKQEPFDVSNFLMSLPWNAQMNRFPYAPSVQSGSVKFNLVPSMLQALYGRDAFAGPGQTRGEYLMSLPRQQMDVLGYAIGQEIQPRVESINWLLGLPAKGIQTSKEWWNAPMEGQ